MSRSKPLDSLIETRQRRGVEYFIQTIDGGPPQHVVTTNLFHDGDIVLSRREPYAPDASEDAVVGRMRTQHQALLVELDRGNLDKQLFPEVDLATLMEQEAAPPERSSAAPARAPAPPMKVSIVRDQPAGEWLVSIDAERASFLENYFTSGKSTGVLVEVLPDVPLGKEVAVHVHFKGPPPREFDVRGVIAFRRQRGEGTLKAGTGITFLPSDTTASERLVEYALGILDPSHERRFRRRMVKDVPVTLESRLGKVKAAALNISEGGVFVVTGVVLPPDEEVKVHVRAGFLRTLSLDGRVVWGRIAAPAGIGINFGSLRPKEERRLAELVEELAVR